MVYMLSQILYDKTVDVGKNYSYCQGVRISIIGKFIAMCRDGFKEPPDYFARAKKRLLITDANSPCKKPLDSL